MAEVFRSFDEFKCYIGGRMNTSVELNSLAPTIYEAAQRHIIPYLSQGQYDEVVARRLPELRPFVQRALALLTVYEYSKVAAIEVSDSGMHRVESDTRKSAYRYQEKQYQNDAREKGYDALELMLSHLSSDLGTYAVWAATDEAMMHRKPLLNYAKDFRRLTDHQCDRFTFESLRPIIASVQRFSIEHALPVSFWSGYITRHLAGTLTTAEKQLREYMQQAIAHLSLQHAQSLLWVTINSGRIYIQEEFGEQSQVNKTMPGSGATNITANLVWSDRYTCLWKKYITDNHSQFPTLFDVSSGGSNTDDDAWHINNDDEQAVINTATTTRISGATFQL